MTVVTFYLQSVTRALDPIGLCSGGDRAKLLAIDGGGYPPGHFRRMVLAKSKAC